MRYEYQGRGAQAALIVEALSPERRERLLRNAGAEQAQAWGMATHTLTLEGHGLLTAGSLDKCMAWVQVAQQEARYGVFPSDVLRAQGVLTENGW